MIRHASVCLGTIFCAACGYVGPPLPPSLNLPARVGDVSAVQRGSKIIIQFTIPKVTTEGLPLKEAPEADVRVGETGATFRTEEWIERSRRVPREGTTAIYETSADAFAGKTVVIGVRIPNDRGRDAGWSNFVALHITKPVARPENVTAVTTAGGVEVRWNNGQASLYRVYRKDQKTEFAPLGETGGSPYLDRTAEYGKAYTYFVQGYETAEGTPSESDISEYVTITPKDTFPPAPPAGVRVIIGTKSLELSWTRNTEPDLAGYRVFRAEGDGALKMIADAVLSPSYSDRTVKSGAHYRYAVVAYDQTGNASEPSTTVAAVLP